MSPASSHALPRASSTRAMRRHLDWRPSSSARTTFASARRRWMDPAADPSSSLNGQLQVSQQDETPFSVLTRHPRSVANAGVVAMCGTARRAHVYARTHHARKHLGRPLTARVVQFDFELKQIARARSPSNHTQTVWFEATVTANDDVCCSRGKSLISCLRLASVRSDTCSLWPRKERLAWQPCTPAGDTAFSSSSRQGVSQRILVREFLSEWTTSTSTRGTGKKDLAGTQAEN